MHPLLAKLDATPISVYQQRRLALMALVAEVHHDAVIVLQTAPAANRNADADYPYRYDSSFYYLTGFNEPEAALILDVGQRQATLLCRVKDETRELWDGFRFGPAAAREQFGFDHSAAIDELDAVMAERLVNRSALGLQLASSAALDAQARTWIDAVRAKARAGVTAPHTVFDVSRWLNEMRLFKDEHELTIMRRAAQISGLAHTRAMRTCRVGAREYHLDAELLYEFRRQGSEFPAYESIVASGPNACILHYRASDRVMQDGELVLIDAGCELHGYASDITRTFPVNGRFTGPQRAIYEVVLASQEAAITATRVGAAFTDPHEAAVRVLAQGMLDLKLLSGTLDQVLDQQTYQRFYMHRTGHWLGMDVHDVGRYRDEPSAVGVEPPSRKLQNGMVLTIEPGLYVRPADDVPPAYWHIGVRIEDDAVVRDQACEIITASTPKSIRDLEALIGTA